MVKLYLLALLCFLQYSSRSQIANYTSSCVNTPTIERIYRNDAYSLSRTRVLQTNSHWKDSITHHQAVADSIAQALYAIHNMTSSTLKDTILNLFGFADFQTFPHFEQDSLHHNPNYNIKVVVVSLANTAPWASSWASGNFTNTATPAIDSVVQKYQLTVTQQYVGVFPTYKVYVLRSPSAINTGALVQFFNQYPDVLEAYHPGYFDGHRITATFNPNGILLKYSYGCQDCPAGCITRVNWYFQVYTFSDCRVEYLNREGLPSSALFGTNYCFRNTILDINTYELFGVKLDNTNKLEWDFTNRTNVASYTLQKSSNGTTFTNLSTVIPTNTQRYTFIDNNPLPTNYYRLKINTTGGNILYSNTVRLLSGKQGVIAIFPNPVVSSFGIEGININKPSTVNLYTLQGKLVQSWVAIINGSSSQFTLPKGVAKGIYQLSIVSNNSVFTGRVVVE